jgi:hypothetical protein
LIGEKQRVDSIISRIKCSVDCEGFPLRIKPRKNCRDPYEEQFHRTSSLMFLVTLMCAWNTVYLQPIRDYFGTIGEVTEDDLWQHVSPARWKHFNMLGHYTFDLGQAHSLDNLRELSLNAPDWEEEMD